METYPKETALVRPRTRVSNRVGAITTAPDAFCSTRARDLARIPGLGLAENRRNMESHMAIREVCELLRSRAS